MMIVGVVVYEYKVNVMRRVGDFLKGLEKACGAPSLEDCNYQLQATFTFGGLGLGASLSPQLPPLIPSTTFGKCRNLTNY